MKGQGKVMMRVKFRAKASLTITTLMLLFKIGHANRPVGYLWDNLPKQEVTKKKNSQTVSFDRLSYRDKVKLLRYYTEETLDKAILSNSLKDTEKFIALQHFWLNKASAFQHNFQYAVIKHPEFDSTVKNPVSAIGTRLNNKRDEKRNNQMINTLTHEYGLMFFYKGSDVYSIKQSYVIKSYAKRHNFKFISISADGKAIPHLDESKYDTGQSERLGIKYFPSIVLVHPKSKKVYPVSSGFVTQDTLTENMMVVAREIARKELGNEVVYE